METPYLSRVLLALTQLPCPARELWGGDRRWQPGVLGGGGARAEQSRRGELWGRRVGTLEQARLSQPLCHVEGAVTQLWSPSPRPQNTLCHPATHTASHCLARDPKRGAGERQRLTGNKFIPSYSTGTRAERGRLSSTAPDQL